MKMEPLFQRSHLLCFTLVLVACGQTDLKEVQPAPQVSTVEVTSSPLEITEILPGRVEAIRTAEIRPQIGGIVQKRLFREGGTVKVSRGLKELSMKAVHLSEQIETETGKAPSVSVLAEKLGVPEEKCAEALNAAAQPVSLTGDDENNETDIPVDAPEEKITDHLALQQILKALPEEDQRLIYYRYFKNQTQTETAKRLGTTQVQISRREKKLLLRLRGLLL